MKVVQKHSKELKNGICFYVGGGVRVPIHPAEIEEETENYLKAKADPENLVNMHGLRVRGRNPDSAAPHFFVHDPDRRSKMDSHFATIHDRVVQIAFEYIKERGSKALEEVTTFANMHKFPYGGCEMEREFDGFRPDISIMRQDKPQIIALEVIHTSGISREKFDQYRALGHVLLSLNIKTKVEDWIDSGYEITDSMILEQLIKGVRFKPPQERYSNAESVIIEWLDYDEKGQWLPPDARRIWAQNAKAYWKRRGVTPPPKSAAWL